MSLPLIYTPFTKFQTAWGGTQGGECGAHYLDYMRCASLVGGVRAKDDCYKELADFHECALSQKQLKRVVIMEKERKRQKRPYIEALGQDIPEKGY